MPVFTSSNIKQLNDSDFKLIVASDVEFDIGAKTTISAGVLTQPADGAYIPVEIDGGGSGSDDLDTITKAAKGTNFIIIHPDTDTDTIVVKHDVGNISCTGQADITLDDIEDLCFLFYDSGVSKWYAFGGGGGAGH